jgi:hypothetical protein
MAHKLTVSKEEKARTEPEEPWPLVIEFHNMTPIVLDIFMSFLPVSPSAGYKQVAATCRRLECYWRRMHYKRLHAELTQIIVHAQANLNSIVHNYILDMHDLQDII